MRQRIAAWMRSVPAGTYGEVAVVLVVWAVTLSQLHPELLVTNTTTTGGDTGAHYILPAFLRDHLLAHGHLTGWFPGWYDGFPLYTYYFVLPDLLAAVGSVVLPYGVAFKAITVLGSLLLPVSAIVLGRGFRLKPPIPAALAAATLPFLFDSTFTIYGGNLFSTLAGEYSFSLGLALALIAVGLFARHVERGRGVVAVAVAVAVAMGAHVLTLMWAALPILLLLLLAVSPLRFGLHDEVHGSRRGVGLSLVLAPPARVLRFALLTGVLILALGAWWLLPFGTLQRYANPMGYTNVTTYSAMLYPSADRWAIWIAAAALVVGVLRLSRFALVTSMATALSGIAVVAIPQGSIYNARLVPFWFIGIYLLDGWLVGLGAAGAYRAFVRWRHRRGTQPGGAGALGGALAIGLLSAVVVAAPFVLPSSLLPVSPGANQVSSWAAWNYSGMEAKSGYPEYRALVAELETVGKTHGCGRAMWEYSSSMDRFGTPMALMLLPYWTEGCIGSMEGLFFESSATTPYHFINQAELSPSPSNPQVGLRYPTLDVAAGVRHLQLLGVRYYLANSSSTIAQAKANPDLTLVGHSKVPGAHRWNIYRVHRSGLVEGLRFPPRVDGPAATSSASWLKVAEPWYLNPARWSRPIAASGPGSWPRSRGEAKASSRLPSVEVSAVARSEAGISFRVDRLGVPVLVKESYFPAWHATGAQGPFRVTPNLMVVVPTSHRVALTYAEAPVQQIGRWVSLLSWLGLIAGVFLWKTRRPRA